MVKNTPVRLSQCMIVKNEEENINQALSWGKDAVYEQIVIDTGSTDRTVQMAEAMGAKVYHFKWIDDFSAAKNFAISKASGDWIAFLDADEYFPACDVEKLMAFLDELDRTPYYVMLTSWMHVNDKNEIFANGAQTRIFKRVAGLGYRNRIHEELALNGGDIVNYTVDATKELTIYHTGYAPDASAEKQKGKRNARLILMELEDSPYNYDMMGYLGDSFYAEGENLDKAVEWYGKAISLMPSRIDEYDVRSAVTFWKLMSILGMKKDEEALMQLYERATRLIPKESDFDYIAGKFYTEKKDFRRGVYHLERALNILEQHGNVNRGQLITGNLRGTWELLAMCHYQNGNLDNCVKCCISLLKTDRYIMSTLIMMMCAFKYEEERGSMGKQNSARAAVCLSSLYDMDKLKDRIFLLRAAMEADYEELVKIVRGACGSEELACFDRSMEQRSAGTVLRR